MEYTTEQEAIIKRANDENLIIVYSASYCGPCRAMAPFIDQVKDTINIIKVDTEESSNLSAQEGIRAIPTIIHYKKGIEVGRQVGGKTQDQLIQFYNN